MRSLFNEPDIFMRAFTIIELHIKKKENDQVILDWAYPLNLGDLLENDVESDQYFREAEYKMIKAAKLGNVHAYYSWHPLFSDRGSQELFPLFTKSKTFDALPFLEDLIEDE